METETTDIISLGLWIKRRRKALDLTQDELASRVGCSLELIRKIEADARRPSREIAARLAEKLELAPDERDAFVRAARAELGADRLAPPARSVARAAFARAAPEPSSSPSDGLPSGTVAFLLAEIAGAARLWERYPQAMLAVQERYTLLVRSAVAARGGVVFKTLGETILAAFGSVPDALAAALEAQQALAGEPWRLPAPPRFRMALHAGSAEPRAGDYAGPALNRAARLLAAGHGGQVLLSLAAEELAREQLPPDTFLRDLGSHRLKDLNLPEHIFQLVAPDLPADFPALNNRDRPHANLPAPPTELIGRDRDVAAVVGLLRDARTRLVTLTGPGGVGKTRLGLQVAGELVDEFAHGVYFVDLAPVRDPALVAGAIAHTLGVRDIHGQPLLDNLKDDLRDRQILLLLDNFEQVIDAAPLVAELLAAAPELKALVTSREPLRLRGEKDVVVAPLALPDPAQLPPLDQLSQYAAVNLFIQRATDAKANFQVTNANAPAVAEICAGLDGLPLAIELAAARVKLFAPEDLLARLSSRLALLAGGPRDLPARQQTMRSTIAWSYDLLTGDEQALFRRLGVFVGGCTLEAACHVLSFELEGMNDQADELKTQNSKLKTLDGIAALVDKSLLRQIEVPSEEPRFVMLETIREYALERLAASGEEQAARRRHADYFIALSSKLVPESEIDDAGNIAALDREYDNLRSDLEWNMTAAGDPELAYRIAQAIATLWYHRGAWREAIDALTRVLAHPLGGKHAATHAAVRADLAQMLTLTGDYAGAQEQFEHFVPLARELGDARLVAWALERLGWVARERGDSATAWKWLAESLAMFRELDNAPCIAGTLTTMAEVAIVDEDPARAEAILAENLSPQRRATIEPIYVGWSLNHLGHAAQLRGDYARAAQLYQESLALFPANYHPAFPFVYHDLGEAALGQGRPDEAARWLRRGLEVSQAHGDRTCLSWDLAAMGCVAVLAEEPERALRLWGAAERLRQTLGCRPAPAARALHERAMATARAQLGESAFAAGWAAGAALTLEQAIAEAMQLDLSDQ